MTRLFLCFCILNVIAFASCKNSNENASAEQAKQEAEANTSSDEIFAVDSTQSLVYWFGSSPTGSHNGLLKLSKGTLHFSNGMLVSGEIYADMQNLKNLDIQDPGDRKDLEDHLKGEDFFNSNSFPYSVFKITRVEHLTDSSFNLLITGTLTVRNTSHELQVKGSLSRSNDQLMISIPEFKIDRTEYGIMYQSKKILASLKDGFIADEISLTMKITAVKMK